MEPATHIPHPTVIDIVNAAFLLAKRPGVGLRGLSRSTIAAAAGCAPSLISHHFGDMAGMHSAVVTAAVEREDLALIAEGLAQCHPIAQAAPGDLKSRALSSLIR